MENIKEKFDKVFDFFKKDKNNLKINYISLVSLFTIICLLFFTVFLNDSFTAGGGKVDGYIEGYILTIRNPMRDSVFLFITNWGNPLSTAIITVFISIIFFILGKGKTAVFFSLSILGVWIFNEIIKNTIRRARPAGVGIIKASGYSFPSGHSMVFLTLIFMLIYFILLFYANTKYAYILSFALFCFGITVGFSRIYLGVHYVSDVIAGWSLSGLWSLAGILLYNRKK